MDQDCLSFFIVMKIRNKTEFSALRETETFGSKLFKKELSYCPEKRPISKEYCQILKYTFSPIAKFGM